MITIQQRLAQAVQFHQAGRLQDAEKLYRDILAEWPHQPHALHLLGLIHHQTGRPAEAFDLIERALAAQGPHPVFLSNLAAVCLALNRLDDAVKHASAAVRLDPKLADGHNNLGVAQRRLGRLDEAEAAFRTALRHNPRHFDARASLGVVLHKKGQLTEAFRVLQETVRLAPTHAQVRNDLGGLLLNINRPDEALVQLQEAVRLRPNFPEAHANLGMVLHNLGRPVEATAALREAIRLNPAYARAHDHLGYVLETQGKLDEALPAFQESLRLEPESSVALAGLTKLALAGKHDLDDSSIDKMRRLAERADVQPDDRCRLLFALAGWLDRHGSPDEAFAYCRRANELRQQLDARLGPPNDPQTHQRYIDRLIATFTPEYFARVAGFGVDSELPVFIVGMMRSGSTLIEQILASHPAVHAAGEVRDVLQLLTALLVRQGNKATYPDCMNRLDRATAQSLAGEYVQRLQQRGGTAARVVDKFLFNYEHLGLIATLFPRARIVHAVRDPVDTCLSCYFQSFAANYPFKLELTALGRYYREYERLMAHWRAVLPRPMFELRYEELTANQEELSRQLIAFCGLEWDERCLRFTEAERPVRTSSVLQVRQPMYRRSVGKWKKYEVHLQPLLAALRGD